MNLSIILRTHDTNSVHTNKRFIEASKKEIVQKCVGSLLSSISSYENKDNISLTVIDDHSSNNTIDFIKNGLSSLDCKTNFIPLSSTGNSESMKKAYEIGLTDKNDLIYFVEDDYFHKMESINIMMNDWKFFTEKLESRPIILVPYDDPFNYSQEHMLPTRVVYGIDRHWRQSYHTTWTMFMSKWALMHFWDKFMAFSQYGVDPKINEDNTINLLYSKFGILLFNPLPFLAFHVCDTPPFVGDWKSLWEKEI